MTLIEEVIERNHLKPEDGSDLTVPCAQFYRGSTHGDMLDVRYPDGWRYEERWSNGYREVYVSDEQRAIFTYCEGDLDLTVDDDESTYRKRYIAAAEFYREAA